MINPTHPPCAPAARVNQLLKEGILQPYLHPETKTALKSTCKAYARHVDNEGVGERIIRFAALLANQIEPSVGNRKAVASRLWQNWSTQTDSRSHLRVLRDCRDLVWKSDETCGHRMGHGPRDLDSSERRHCNALMWSAKYDKTLKQGLAAIDDARAWKTGQLIELLAQDACVVSATVAGFGTAGWLAYVGATTLAPASAAHWKIGGVVGKTAGVVFGCSSAGFVALGALVALGATEMAKTHVDETSEAHRIHFMTEPVRDYVFCEMVTNRRHTPRLHVEA